MFKGIFTQQPLKNIVLDGVDFTLEHVLRKNMKRMILRVEKKNHIRLTSSKVPKKHLEAFVYENKNWIFEQQRKIRDFFEEDSLFYYLGNPYSIKHHEKSFCITDTEVYVNLEDAKRQTDDFYKLSAKAYLPSRFEYWKEIMGLNANKLGFRLAKRRWGSCNSKKNISLNPYMMKLSHDMIDYIIVHELSHLVHLNHSSEFYKLVSDYLPDYKNTEKKIKALSSKIH